MKKKRFVVVEVLTDQVLTHEMTQLEAEAFKLRLQTLAEHNNSGKKYRVIDIEAVRKN